MVFSRLYLSLSEDHLLKMKKIIENRAEQTLKTLAQLNLQHF